MISEEDQDLLLVRLRSSDFRFAGTGTGAFAMLAQIGYRDDLVTEDVAPFWNRTHLNGGVYGVALHPRDEENPIPRQLPEPHVIVVAAVYGKDRARLQAQVTGYVQLRLLLSLRHHFRNEAGR